MGHPKKQRRKYSRPKRPYNKERIELEKKIMKEFGLRRKKEIWRAEEILRNFRRRARDLQARPDERKKKMLFEKLERMGLVDKNAKLEDVLEISLNDILSRRLQTIVYKKGLANTIKQARQFIVHGKVFVNGRKHPFPGTFINREDEESIMLDEKMKKLVGDEKS